MNTPDSLGHGRYLELLDRDGWEYVSRTRGSNVVGMIALTTEDEVILVEQFRPSVNRRVLELPAGLVGDEEAGEDPMSAARRELEEETGYASDDWTHFGTGLSSSGLCDESLEILVALDCHKIGDGGGVAGEDIKVILVPRRGLHDHVREYVANDGLIDLKIYLADTAVNIARRSMPTDDQ